MAANIDLSLHPEHDFELCFGGLALFILWLFIMVIRALFAMWHNLRKKTLSFALSLLCLWPTGYLLRIFPIGDYVHLARDYSNYQARINTAPRKRWEFNWGGTGWAAGPSTERNLIYDPMDKLPQENKLKDAELKKEYSHLNGVRQLWLITKPLFGHFYLVETCHQA